MKDKNLIFIGTSIRERREILDLTQEQVAESAELDVGHYSKIERGIKTPSLSTLFRIAKALEISPAELLPGSTAPALSSPVVKGIIDLTSGLTDAQAKEVLKALRTLLSISIKRR